MHQSVSCDEELRQRALTDGVYVTFGVTDTFNANLTLSLYNILPSAGATGGLPACLCAARVSWVRIWMSPLQVWVWFQGFEHHVDVLA